MQSVPVLSLLLGACEGPVLLRTSTQGQSQKVRILPELGVGKGGEGDQRLLHPRLSLAEKPSPSCAVSVCTPTTTAELTRRGCVARYNWNELWKGPSWHA